MQDNSSASVTFVVEVFHSFQVASSNRQVDGHVSPLAHGNIEDQTLVLVEFGYS